MKKIESNILHFLILTLVSCSQHPNQHKTTAIGPDVLKNTRDNQIKTETLKQEIDSSFSELSKFVPKNYSILDTISGDLNLDNINDYILVLNKNGEDTISDVIDNPERRPLMILLRDQFNKLRLEKRNDNTVYCINCGGMMGDPFSGISIKNGYFSVEHYGGSAWRWSRIITYKYSKRDKEWYLHKDGSESFHTTEPEKVESQIETIKDFGQVRFEDFYIYEKD